MFISSPSTKKFFLFLILILFGCWFLHGRRVASGSLKNSSKTAAATSSYQHAHVNSSSSPSSSLSSSLFSKALENNTQRAVSFLPYPPAPLQELSEQEASDFPGAHVMESSESEVPYYKVRQRILETSFKYPYLKTEELIDSETGNLVARLEMVANQFLITLQEEEDPQQFLRRFGPQALFITRISKSKPIYRVALRDASLSSLPAAFKQVQENSPRGIFGEPDYLAHNTQRPSNYGYPYQWGLWKVNHFNSFKKPYAPLVNQYCYHLNKWCEAKKEHLKPQDDSFYAQEFNFLTQESCKASTKFFDDASTLEPTNPDEPECFQDYFSAERGINAEDAWDVRTSAASVVVAVVDSGIRYTHKNLKNNMWHNPNPDPKLHDVYGKNLVDNNGDPMDKDGHGTHCAGVIGGEMSNSLGVAGVAWKVQLMACKYVEEQVGAESDAISALDYAKEHHADIVNCSFGWSAYVCVFGPKQGEVIPTNNDVLKEELSSLRESGIIVVAAAGNNGRDDDCPQTFGNDYENKWVIQNYPACYSAELDNIVSVAATDYFEGRNESKFSHFQDREGLACFSNYGSKSVTLAAPGVFILSTYHLSDDSYAFLDGTSMAAPFVTGALALMKAEFPTYSYRELIDHLIETTDPLPSLQGKMRGGRLNLARALRPTPLTPPPSGITPPPPLLPLFPQCGMQDPVYWWY